MFYSSRKEVSGNVYFTEFISKGKKIFENLIRRSIKENEKANWYCNLLFWFGLVWFYGLSNVVDYLMLNPLYTYILNIYDLVWLGWMAYQPL